VSCISRHQLPLAALGNLELQANPFLSVLAGFLADLALNGFVFGAVRDALNHGLAQRAYPQVPMTRIIGSDIAHAVPLTLVAGIGYWAIGAVDWHLMGSLLVGSLPGIVIGSYCTVRVPETALRLVLAATLIVVAGKLASDELHASSSMLTAFTRSAPDSMVTAGIVRPER
jgi:uncharacterized membrane protein YfcA